jgi:hypothetical protein
VIGRPESLADMVSAGGVSSVFEIAVAAAIVLSGLTITFGSCITLLSSTPLVLKCCGFCVEDAQRSVNHKTPSS